MKGSRLGRFSTLHIVVESAHLSTSVAIAAEFLLALMRSTSSFFGVLALAIEKS